MDFFNGLLVYGPRRGGVERGEQRDGVQRAMGERFHADGYLPLAIPRAMILTKPANGCPGRSPPR